MAALIVGGRRARRTVELPERLRTRHWASVESVLLAVDGRTRPGRSGLEDRRGQRGVRRAERLPSPSPGVIYPHTIFPSDALLPASLFINYRCCECEFAFR